MIPALTLLLVSLVAAVLWSRRPEVTLKGFENGTGSWKRWTEVIGRGT